LNMPCFYVLHQPGSVAEKMLTTHHYRNLWTKVPKMLESAYETKIQPYLQSCVVFDHAASGQIRGTIRWIGVMHEYTEAVVDAFNKFGVKFIESADAKDPTVEKKKQRKGSFKSGGSLIKRWSFEKSTGLNEGDIWQLRKEIDAQQSRNKGDAPAKLTIWVAIEVIDPKKKPDQGDDSFPWFPTVEQGKRNKSGKKIGGNPLFSARNPQSNIVMMMHDKVALLPAQSGSGYQKSTEMAPITEAEIENGFPNVKVQQDSRAGRIVMLDPVLLEQASVEGVVDRLLEVQDEGEAAAVIIPFNKTHYALNAIKAGPSVPPVQTSKVKAKSNLIKIPVVLQPDPRSSEDSDFM
jgi:hypothetical protein